MSVSGSGEDGRKNKPLVKGGNLGTFAGVFTPSILTILGIILFLRLGYVTGSVGVGRAFLIIAVANVITILTSQSLAAIATNLKVKSGGDYYLISRTLGVEFGGSIGIVLYMAQSVSVAFYCIGFAEALTAIIGPDYFLSARLIALMAVSAVFGLAWLGSDWATRFQYLVMALLVCSLFSFFVGGIPQWQGEMFIANWSPPKEPLSFWIVFGVFFPAVTGFTQGVSMSGDLKDPGKSLPLGTFLAVGFSIVIYFAVVIVFAGVVPNETLAADYQAIKHVSRYDFLIDAGVIAATLSSAMASFLGGPRILQSLASDKIFPILTPFAKGTGAVNNPRRAIILTGTIAFAVIMFGHLNIVARIVSMFFLISYALLNYATWYEAHSESPSFRPRFKWFSKYLSLLGFFFCVAIIFALDMEYGLVAAAILAAIYQYVKGREGPSRWADSGRSHAMNIIRKQLLTAQEKPEHDRNWRPHTLIFTRDHERRAALLKFGDWIGGHSGLISAVEIVEGAEPHVSIVKEDALKELTNCIHEANLNIFPLVVTSPDFSTALPVLLQGYGVGPLQGNTIISNWYGETMTSFPGLTAMKFGHNLLVGFRKGYNLVVFHVDPLRTGHIDDPNKNNRVIDVWWSNDASSHLMLLFAYLMTRTELWANASIRLLTEEEVAGSAKSIEQLEQQLDDVRISAEPVIVADTRHETVVAESVSSTLVFLPFRIRRSMLSDMHGYSLERVLNSLPPTALVMAAEDIDLDAEPEEGVAGELARALDTLYEVEKRADKVEKQHKKNQQQVETIEEQIAGDSTSLGEQALAERAEKLTEARNTAEKSFRKVAKEKAKLDSALTLVQQLGDSETR